MEQHNYTEQTEDLYQNAPFGYLTILVTGEIININNTLLNWLNFKRDEALKTMFFQDLLGVGEKIFFESRVMPLLQMQGEVSEINLELKGKGTLRFPALINFKKIQRKPTDALVYRISVLDITQRKNFEKELIKARKEAEENANRLKRINIDLERFAYIASHDLKAPLNTIESIVALIKDENLVEPDGDRDELFSLITVNTNRMKMMINDLLECSSIEDTSSKFEPVYLNEICLEALGTLDEAVRKNQAIFNIPELPEVAGIKIQLVRLFQNLFSNAIKYRSEADPIVTVSWEKKDTYYTFRIKDNGMGFEQKEENKIFGFMERLNTSKAISGTGIGLSSCKRIVEVHGGTIGVTSAPGKGSTFYFTLPIKR